MKNEEPNVRFDLQQVSNHYDPPNQPTLGQHPSPIRMASDLTHVFRLPKRHELWGYGPQGEE